MYKIFIIVIFILGSFNWGYGQNAFRTISTSFKNSEQFFSSELNKKTIKLYLKEKQPSTEISDILNHINNLRVVSFTADSEKEVSRFIELVNSEFNLADYTPFKVKTSGINNQLIYLKEQNDLISNLLVINTNYQQISMVEILGEIDLEKIALLQKALNINGLENLSSINNEQKIKENSNQKITKHKQNNQYNKPFTVVDNYFLPYKTGGVSVYNRRGTKLINTSNEPSLLINGYLTNTDFQTTLSELNPNCIQSINVSKNDDMMQSNGHIDVMLKGDVSEIFTVCDGILYFGQNGYFQCIKIDDDCSPSLLYNCNKKPLSDILQMEPNQIKSIELTSDPRDCEGILEGEYIVVETK